MDPNDLSETAHADDAAGQGSGFDTGGQGDGAIETGQETQPDQTQSFINPADLPEELKPHWSKMHGAFTKKMQEVKDIRQAYDQINQFWQDDSYAQQVLRQRFPHLGNQPNGDNGPRSSASSGQESSGGAAGVPQDFVDSLKSSVSPDLQFVVNELAPGLWKSLQGQISTAVGGIQERLDQQTSEQQQEKFTQLEAQLDQKFPGWQQHESDMTNLLAFLQSNKIEDRRWGNKLELLLNLVSGNGQSVSQAVDRINQAGKNRIPTSSHGSRKPVNTSERILKARTSREATELAMEEAEKTLAKDGIKLW